MPAPVTLTRRTQRFGELARLIEGRLAEAGVVVDPKGIDEQLRTRIRAVGVHLGVSDRTALIGYATDEVAQAIAAENLAFARDLLERLDPPRPSVGRPRHLSLVQQVRDQ